MRCNPRYWVHVANKKLPIIHPNAWYRVTWDVFVLILVLYNAAIVPYEVGGVHEPSPDMLDHVSSPDCALLGNCTPRVMAPS